MTITTEATTNGTMSVLEPGLLEECASRAAGYDQDNRFFSEDFDALKAAGYLNIAVPTELGGLGMTLAEVCREQRRLAYRSPATALATNMHVYWTGVAADLYRSGDASLRWVLEESAAGEVFAAGHGERGNDSPVIYSSSKAEPVSGGYRFTGHKMFGSLSPVWTRLGVHALDDSDPANPKIVHAFMPRDTEGYTIKETWNTLGMRATRSDDTILDGAFVPDRYIARVVPQGLAGADEFVLAIFAWAQCTFANVYLAIAERARDLAIEGIKAKTSVALGGRSMAYHPMVQHSVAEMQLAIDAMTAHADRIPDDWGQGYGPAYGEAWPLKLISLKHHCTEGAKRVVDLAMETSGGGGMFKGNELERLYRDVRCGGFHPANSALVHEFVGKGMLGVLGEEPRW